MLLAYNVGKFNCLLLHATNTCVVTVGCHRKQEGRDMSTACQEAIRYNLSLWDMGHHSRTSISIIANTFGEQSLGPCTEVAFVEGLFNCTQNTNSGP